MFNQQRKEHIQGLCWCWGTRVWLSPGHVSCCYCNCLGKCLGTLGISTVLRNWVFYLGLLNLRSQERWDLIFCQDERIARIFAAYIADRYVGFCPTINLTATGATQVGMPSHLIMLNGSSAKLRPSQARREGGEFLLRCENLCLPGKDNFFEI